MTTIVDETINVIAIFESPPRSGDSQPSHAAMRPVKFRWRGRLYPVEEITYRWQSTEGRSTILHFSVSDGRALYELTCNKDSLKWRLGSIEA
ncbi:hypothetical protein MNBD_DELTA01-2135 [hydrothermal vent metagenome]|uniref:DUF6504 domain-containing protein n=1 Tax=hydrothermal vent metagenome TaxID=652676 RepID=A0A3B0QPJ8_9ZZZZ